MAARSIKCFCCSKILKFLCFRQEFFGRALDPDEDKEKVCLHHGFDQFGPLSEINRCLREKQKRIITSLLPRFHLLGQLKSELVVSDEIIVDDKDRLTPAEIDQGLQFRQQLAGPLRSRLSPIKRDDVAKFALEGTTAGELH